MLRIRGHLYDPESWNQKVTYRLPFAGEWLVANGGITEEASHSWELLNQRFAYDFVVADSSGRRHRGTGDKLEDYYCYGKPVLAPAEGVVVAVKDRVRDAPRPGDLWLDCWSRDFRGNHVVIRHAEREYSLMAHFIPGSLKVRRGERVARGQEIARCGNSGHSTEPHLHFQLQDTRQFYNAVGCPVKFSDLVVEGEEKEEIFLEKGMWVRSNAY